MLPATAPTELTTLARLIAAAGFQLRLELAKPETPDATMDVYKRDIDWTLLRENLKKTPQQRLRGLTELARFASAARRARRSMNVARRGRRD